MNRLALVTIAALCLAPSLASAQADSTLHFPPTKGCHFCGLRDYTYSKFTDTTLASYEVKVGSNNPFAGDDGPGRVGMLRATYGFAGQRPAAPPDSVSLYLTVGTRQQQRAAATTAARDNSRPLMFILDDATHLRFPAMRVNAALEAHATGTATDLSESTRQADITEEYVARVSLHDFLAIVNASKIEGALGDSDLSINKNAQGGLREFAGYMNPATPPEVK